MFHPTAGPMERGWVGRIEGEHVVHLAAQTLESFFTGGGTAREHAVYPLESVRLLAPVLHPPSVRVFELESSFAFANPAAIVGPGAVIPSGGVALALLPRLAGVVGHEGEIAGFTCFGDWRRPAAQPPKDRDFALGLGPVVVTGDRFDGNVSAVLRVDGEERLRSAVSGFEWNEARDLARENTHLRPGDLLAGPALGAAVEIPAEASVEFEIEGIGTLRCLVQAQALSR